MKLSAPATLVLMALCAWAQPQSTPIAWGTPVNGLRLGAALGSDPLKPTLRIALQNVGSDFQEVVLGGNQASPVERLMGCGKRCTPCRHFHTVL
jgi:hypothetical protein